MNRALRWAIAIAALTTSFEAGRFSTRAAPPRVREDLSIAPAPQPWAMQGFRGAECQVLGAIPECD